MNHFSICMSCIYSNSCLLTAQKDKVWSCSEFDDIEPSQVTMKNVQRPKRTLELV